jgi:hypothetical protein
VFSADTLAPAPLPVPQRLSRSSLRAPQTTAERVRGKAGGQQGSMPDDLCAPSFMFSALQDACAVILAFACLPCRSVGQVQSCRDKGFFGVAVTKGDMCRWIEVLILVWAPAGTAQFGSQYPICPGAGGNTTHQNPTVSSTAGSKWLGVIRKMTHQGTLQEGAAPQHGVK